VVFDSWRNRRRSHRFSARQRATIGSLRSIPHAASTVAEVVAVAAVKAAVVAHSGHIVVSGCSYWKTIEHRSFRQAAA
jgi:hypothetical protein